MIVFSARQWEGEYRTDDGPPTPFTSAIYLVPADGSAPPREVVRVGDRADYPAYSPDGRWLYFQATDGGHYQVFRCREDGSAVENLTGSHQPPCDRYGRAFCADGSRLAFTCHNGELGRVAVMNADGSGETLVAPELGYHYMGALSPDGRSVAFAHTARGYVLELKHLDTGRLLTLTPDLPDSYCPQFAPDGRTIVFFRRDGDVYSVGADGSNLRRLTKGNGYVEFRLGPADKHGSSDPPVVSADGRRIAYVALREGLPQIHVMGLDGTDQRQVTFRPTACGRPRFSPDGTQLAFVSWEGRFPQLFVVPVAGGAPRQLTRLAAAVYFVDWKPSHNR